MNSEVERKFFFDPRLWRGRPFGSTVLEQGYLADTGSWEARLRRSGAELKYTMKSGSGLARDEWEIRLAATDFEALWPLTEGRRVLKRRDRYRHRRLTVEVDLYDGKLLGLTVAEVEFPSRAAASGFSVPRGFGPELTYDPRFKNRALAEGTVVPLLPPDHDPAGWSFGALPYRRGPKGWELVIVTTRRQDRWIFPKGQPEPGLGFDKVALAEAKEEAGVAGKVTGHPIVVPHARDTGTTNLLLYPVAVTALADRWLELGQRDRKVIRLEDAESHGELIALGARWLRDWLPH